MCTLAKLISIFSLLHFTKAQCPLSDNWSVIERELYVPELDHISVVLEEELQSYFEYVDAEVTQCPDLREAPYSMASAGISGNTRLLNIGHLSNIVPLVNRNKTYKLVDMATLAEVRNGYIFGGGGGPFRQMGSNCEGIFNYHVQNCELEQHSTIAIIDRESPRGFTVRRLTNDYTDVGIAATLFASSGERQNIVRINVRRRINSTFEITHGIRSILASHFGHDYPVGLGIIIVVREATCRVQVMPDFSNSPIYGGSKGFFKWVHYFNMSSPLTLLGTLVTEDLGYDLYSPHFHVVSNHGEAGHWHYDLSPDTVEYEILISPGERLYVIDHPENTI